MSDHGTRGSGTGSSEIELEAADQTNEKLAYGSFGRQRIEPKLVGQRVCHEQVARVLRWRCKLLVALFAPALAALASSRLGRGADDPQALHQWAGARRPGFAGRVRGRNLGRHDRLHGLGAPPELPPARLEERRQEQVHASDASTDGADGDTVAAPADADDARAQERERVRMRRVERVRPRENLHTRRAAGVPCK